MKIFSYFILTIFFVIGTGLALINLDPGVKDNLNFRNIVIFSSLLFFSIAFFYIFLSSLFTAGHQNIYHILRAFLLASLGVGIFILKILSLLTIPVFIILGIIYILSEITLYEIGKK